MAPKSQRSLPSGPHQCPIFDPFSQFFPFFSPIHAYNFRSDFSLIFFQSCPQVSNLKNEKDSCWNRIREQKKTFSLNRYIYDKLTLGTQVIREKILTVSILRAKE